MSTNIAYAITPSARKQLADLSYEQVSIGTWRADAEDVMAFVIIMPTDRVVTGHLTRKNATSATDKPYSQEWAAEYSEDPSRAVEACAQHMLGMAQEHTQAGTLRFQRFTAGPSGRILLGSFP